MLIKLTDSLYVTSTDFAKGLPVCKQNKYWHCTIQYGGQRLANLIGL